MMMTCIFKLTLRISYTILFSCPSFHLCIMCIHEIIIMFHRYSSLIGTLGRKLQTKRKRAEETNTKTVSDTNNTSNKKSKFKKPID